MTPYYEHAGVTFLHGNALDVLREMEDESVNCCITSPPYWGLRDYGAEGQLGLERTPEEYIARMVEVFREVRRLLRDDGTLWLNIGDSYATGAGSARSPGGDLFGKANKAVESGAFPVSQPNRMKLPGFKPKDLVGIPWMLAFALRADGWYLRSEIIWHKPNPMPESVTDRPTKAHEQIFLLAKSERYYYDFAAIKEPAAYSGTNSPESIKSPYGQGFTRANEPASFKGSKFHTGKTGQHQLGRSSNSPRVTGNLPGRDDRGWACNGPGQETRNKRSVWTVPTEPFTMWQETARRVRVRVDAPCDGSERIASPDCRLHGGSTDPASSASYGGHEDLLSPHSDSIGDDLALMPLTGSVPTEKIHEPDSAPENLGSPAPLCADSATGRSKEKSKKDRAPLTSPPYTPSVQTEYGTERIPATPWFFDLVGHTPASNSVAVDGSPVESPLGEIQRRIASTCTCEHYITKTDKISHFATFPPDLILPCVLAGCPTGGLILDPFSGAGTTALVAKENGRKCVGIELNKDYIDMSIRRVRQDNLFSGEIASASV